ncbi:phosphatidylserine decarboxylase-domain-containing protein [Amylostereum chailletii]|nr:phosphatidylserine decarboxylase-domain-containing protein [Amylostereum chailletii]
MVAAKKAQKIGRAIRSAARLPIRVSSGKGGNKNPFAPIPGELPIVLLKVQILNCQDLLSKDKNGFSDPLVVVSVLNTRQQTPVVKRSTSPVYQAKDATFDFPIFLSLADKLGAVELVVWDKDMLKKDYLGEHALPLEDWFRESAYAFDDPNNEPITVNLVSTRANTLPSGTMRLKLGFVQPPGVVNLADFAETYEELVKRSRPSLVSAPPTEGIGTIRSSHTGPEYEDDGLSSDEDENSEDDEDETPTQTQAQSRKSSQSMGVYAPGPLTGAPEQAAKASPPSKPPSPKIKASIPKILRRPQLSTSSSYDATSAPPTHRTVSSMTTSSEKRRRLRRSWAGPKKGAYDFDAGNDVVGIVMLEIEGATDLPKLKNMTRTGWDMDPFVVISFGKKVFRTRVIRHSLNPTWDEKLLFHVRRYETSFSVQLSVLDWDKLSSNDHVGDATFEVARLMANVPQKDPNTGLYPEEEDGSRTFEEFKLPLQTPKESPWEAKHNPMITFRAKYQPYDALRQRFWYQIIKQYDTDDTGTISHLELTSLLDSLGSTLSAGTISGFWERYNKQIEVDDELTYAEIIRCLEEEIYRPNSEKKRIDPRENENREGTFTSATTTPNPFAPGAQPNVGLEGLDFSGPALNIPHPANAETNATPDPRGAHETEEAQVVVIPNSRTNSSASSTPGTPTAPLPTTTAVTSHSHSASSSDAEDYGSGSSSGSNDEAVERVINVKNCPLCHRPRMNSKAERDIVTHLAVCASSDWARVDRIISGNFVTASQAQRKWYTKVLNKVSTGNYKLGANSANIIVQNRMTGQLEEEKMQVYVRLGIRLLYKGARGRLEGARARRLLKSLSIKQGIKYDSPASALDIPSFIEFHNLKVNEILDPLDSFKNFNQFFYRKLKPEARPVEALDDPTRLVSAADCRLMAFESVTEATKLWIKGREFSVARLLGDTYKDQFDRYNGGALVIFRLAPQDYHRFHSPVDGTIGPMTYIAGEYYTVNPQAIRTTLDVYGENARKIVPIDSPQFGRVMAVCIGAMMVGTIQTTVTEGEQVKRGQEFGYFAFGGSTIVVLFEKGVVKWDEDLLVNGRASLETLVRVGMGIGRRVGPPPSLADASPRP